jgi:hypothetical protein
MTLWRILKHQKNSMLRVKKVSTNYVVLLVIPIVLAAFTHFWNSVDFPGIHNDEGHYVRRGIHVSQGLGPQEESSRYDHPYFGWLFLGNIFAITGYPDSLSPKPGEVSSIEAIWSFPRIIMGLLAVADTFLIYKIAETRYGRKVAFIAAVLFAVMPYSWLTRRVFLETIQLPFILLSIFFAISYLANVSKDWNRMINTNDNRNGVQNYTSFGNNIKNSKSVLLIFISGIFLGLAIFTKIPSFTFIPLVGFTIYAAGTKKQRGEDGLGKINNKYNSKTNGIKNLSFWFIAVVLIPLIWPTYALSVGQYEDWIEGINFQVTRESKPLLDNIRDFYSIDPVLLIFGIAGVGYCAAIKREFLFLIWIVPFLIFLYIMDYVSSFFLITLLPPLSIAPAVMMTDLSDRFAKNRNRIKLWLPIGIVSVIAIFGLINTTVLISGSENSYYLELATAVTRQLPTDAGTNDGASSSKEGPVTVIGNARYLWLLQYAFDRPQYSYKTQYNLINIHTLDSILEGSEKVILIADEGIMEIVKNTKEPDNAKAEQRAERLSAIYFNTVLKDNVGGAEVRTNY